MGLRLPTPLLYSAPPASSPLPCYPPSLSQLFVKQSSSRTKTHSVPFPLSGPFVLLDIARSFILETSQGRILKEIVPHVSLLSVCPIVPMRRESLSLGTTDFSSFFSRSILGSPLYISPSPLLIKHLPPPNIIP